MGVGPTTPIHEIESAAGVTLSVCAMAMRGNIAPGRHVQRRFSEMTRGTRQGRASQAEALNRPVEQLPVISHHLADGCCRIVGGDGLTLRRVIGKPSDTNCNSYVLPFLSIALQEILETCLAAKFPSCVHVPADNSTNGTGRPSTFGLFLEFSSIRSIGSWYRSSCCLWPFSPENEMT